MYTLFAQIARLLSTDGAAPAVSDPASELPAQLMQSAGARAGHDQRQAQELRAAAAAYLRVVR